MTVFSLCKQSFRITGLVCSCSGATWRKSVISPLGLFKIFLKVCAPTSQTLNRVAGDLNSQSITASLFLSSRHNQSALLSHYDIQALYEIILLQTREPCFVRLSGDRAHTHCNLILRFMSEYRLVPGCWLFTDKPDVE